MELIRSRDWSMTPTGEERGYIQPHRIRELWFHTGTRCNLECGFCLEGSSPSDNRLQALTLLEAKAFIDEAVGLGVEQFSFTGGEPFLIKDFVKIIGYASKFNPCLILTNGTDSPLKRLPDLQKAVEGHRPVSFRVSIDFPSQAKHDEGRGDGTFQQSLIGLKRLHDCGFQVSVARHMESGENTEEVESAYSALFKNFGLPEGIHLVAFPDFLRPGSIPDVPHITTRCMTTYQTQSQREHYMCATSKMIVKKNNRLKVYACTLVDDDEEYALADTLRASMEQKISMKHHRCYSCFALGASCSEL